jgi:hypothetical protein
MELSSTFCRVQETYQRDRASNTILENVRAVAGKAATAWGIMALGAERREARRQRTRIIADMAALQDERSPDEEDRLFSEKPDRGCAIPDLA